MRLDHLLSKEEKILGVILLGFQGNPEAKREQRESKEREPLQRGIRSRNLENYTTTEQLPGFSEELNSCD